MLVHRRRLDQKKEKWLRFEIELACEPTDAAMLEDPASPDGQSNLVGQEVLNLALYDQADPNNLFLATVDKAKFERLQARQNLKIE